MGEWFLRGWFGFWIWVLYALRLRRPLNNLQRWIVAESKRPRLPLEPMRVPGDLRARLADFNWRKDGTRIGGLFIPLDYVSHPEVTEARLQNGEKADGDCDDAHHYAAVQLETMIGVDEVLHVSVGYPGGGHMACVYLFQDRWWLLNYGKIIAIGGPLEAGPELMSWADHAGKRPRWLLFETTDFRRVKP